MGGKSVARERSKRKTASVVAIALVSVVVLLVVVWTLSVDRAISASIEYYGSEALGTPVRVGWVSLATAEGRATIRDLRIAQPTGFGAGDVIVVDEITLQLDPASLVDGDPYVVHLVRIDGPRVNYVIQRDRSTNLAALQQNLDRNASAAQPSEPPPADVVEARLRIVRLEIEGGRVDADMTALGIGRAEVALAPLHMDDLGGATGTSPGRIAQRVGSHFITTTLTKIAQSTIGRRLEQLFDQGSRGVRGMLDALFPR
jgi:hypothetical protein